MTLNDFLQANNISWQIEKFDSPTRFCISLKQDNLEVYVMLQGQKALAVGVGATSKQAVARLIENIKGNRLRIKGCNSKDEYIDLIIKVPKDLELGE